MKIQTIASTKIRSSFEHIVVDVDCYSNLFLFMVIYHPPAALNTFFSNFFVTYQTVCVYHVASPTHINDHTLDLVITPSMDIMRDIYIFDPAISDHLLIMCSLEIREPVRPERSAGFR